MKKLKKYFLLGFFLIFILLPKKIFAFEFIKYSGNPLVIENFSELNFIDLRQVYIYKEDNKYIGILAAKKNNQNYYTLVKIESYDGYRWRITKELFNNGLDLTNPRLFIDNQGNIKLIFAYQESSDYYKIFSLDCDKELNCQNFQQFFLTPDKNNSYENHGFFAPFVYFNNGIYYLFYGSWGNSGFYINLAYSEDLSNWIKCRQNFLNLSADGIFIKELEGKLYAFFHYSQGIGYGEISEPLTCQSNFTFKKLLLTKNSFYDQKHMIYPTVLEEENRILIYYTGWGNDNNWKINLSYYLKPTPMPTPKIPIILIPGFMASWNKQAMIYNQEVDYTQWKMFSFVKEYNGIIKTLENLDYKKNDNLFIFNYDWRKSVDNIVDDLKSFIDSKNLNKVNIVGHSLGGLVARIFSQKYYQDNKVNKIISVGSPHYGVVQTYKPVFFGEIDRENTFLWLAQKLVLQLNKKLFQSDKEVINNRFPVLRDLLPVYDYLYKENEIIGFNSIEIKNNFLLNYNSNFSLIFSIFKAIYGEKDSKTPNGYIVNNNLYPLSQLYSYGDYTVLSQSAYNDQDSDFEKINLDHGEIIYKKEAIKKILDSLNIIYQDEKIVEGERTRISPSLIFIIKSPAVMELIDDEKTINEDEGIIFYDDVIEKDYLLKVKGLEKGKYELLIGKIYDNSDVWEEKQGEIIEEQPESQIDSYLISMLPESTPTLIPTMILTITPTITLTPTPTLVPTPISSVSRTLTVNIVNSDSQKFITSTINNSNNQNQNQEKIISIITPTPTMIIYSFQKEENNDQNQVLGEKTKKQSDIKSRESIKKEFKKNNFILLLISFIVIIIFIVKLKLFRRQ